jgi:hypothetical protein
MSPPLERRQPAPVVQVGFGKFAFRSVLQLAELFADLFAESIQQPSERNAESIQHVRQFSKYPKMAFCGERATFCAA